MYCQKCGAEIMEEAVICPKCGCLTGKATMQEITSASKPVSTNSGVSGMKKAAQIFMIVSVVVMALIAIGGMYIGLIILAWSIPMTVVYSNKIKNNQPVGVGFKICTLLFVNTIAGILMLCDKE